MKKSLTTTALTLFLGFHAATATAAEWTVLFDGKLTDQLRGYQMKTFPADKWIIDGDALKTIPGKATDLITKDKYKDFELELEWKVAPGGNSGVMYRVAELDKGASWFTGPEMQILDDDKHGDGKTRRPPPARSTPSSPRMRRRSSSPSASSTRPNSSSKTTTSNTGSTVRKSWNTPGAAAKSPNW